MRGRERIAIAISIVIFVLLLSLVLTAGGLGYILPPPKIRDIPLIYLIRSYWPFSKYFTVMSPEVVTSIVWDFRGLDTLFETVVFYLAIIASIAVMRGIFSSKKEVDLAKLGMSPIVKTVTKITIGMILAVAASIALHGHLTPGGGFQGGATAAVVSLVMLVVFSKYYLETHGVSKNSMLVIRSLGLLGVGLTAFIVVIIGLLNGVNAYVFQNQPKIVADVGMPVTIGGALISGTLWFFNLFEMFAVAAGFTIIFLLLAIPEKEVLEQLKKEVAGE
ncbi:MAG: sodium:proton antiporter [Thermoprotei archaeon]|nr:MAG: sodium:proton antiporter [Thermoprotei archaeon]